MNNRHDPAELAEAEGASADMLHTALQRAGEPLDRPERPTVVQLRDDEAAKQAQAMAEAERLMAAERERRQVKATALMAWVMRLRCQRGPKFVVSADDVQSLEQIELWLERISETEAIEP
jgi:hypothetical protein